MNPNHLIKKVNNRIHGSIQRFQENVGQKAKIKNGLSFDKLCKNREGKKIIKQTVNHNKDEFKRILKNIKVEKGLIKFENN